MGNNEVQVGVGLLVVVGQGIKFERRKNSTAFLPRSFSCILKHLGQLLFLLVHRLKTSVRVTEPAVLEEQYNRLRAPRSRTTVLDVLSHTITTLLNFLRITRFTPNEGHE